MLALVPALLLPGTAPASPHNARAAGCRIDLSSEPGSLTAGETATLTGSLSCPIAAEAAEQTVTIYRHAAGATGADVVASITPQADGAYSLTTEPLDANSVFYARSEGAHSPRIPVKVIPLVTIGGPPTGAPLYMARHRNHASARAGNTVTLTGTVSPGEAGARVALQREGANGNEDWSEIALGEVATNGTYSITHTFTVPGAINLRAVVRAPGLLPGVSEPISYELARPQNAQLTIQADPQPLSYGQSVSIGGAAAGGAHRLLTLLVSTGGSAFAPLATTTSTTGGSYAFPAQSPIQNTLYRVSDGHESSTSVFEGVHPVLSTEPSSTSLAAGEALKLTGTLTPARAGEAVELQRQNADGLGFHVVETGTLGPGGAFSIEHVLAGAGTQGYRVRVAGDSQLQGAASAVFKVQVTAASDPSPEPQAPVSEPAPSGES